MTKTKEKPVLMTIGNVRIIEYDASNVVLERLEEVAHAITKEVSMNWRFKGFHMSVYEALRSIVTKELLVDKSALKEIDSYLMQVEKSNAAVLQALKNARLQSDA